VCGSGNVTDDVIADYIRVQGGEPQSHDRFQVSDSRYCSCVIDMAMVVHHEHRASHGVDAARRNVGEAWSGLLLSRPTSRLKANSQPLAIVQLASNMGKVPKKKPGVLADHKKVGKKFIPPFVAHVGPIQEVLWANDLVPELLWLALVNEKHGKQVGADVSRRLAQAAGGAWGAKPRKWFALTSAYQALDAIEREAVLASLSASGSLGLIREALLPFPLLYPECPLNFLFTQPPAADSAVLPWFKEVLESTYDRWGVTATFVQANAVYIAFVTDMLKVFKGLALANFPAIEAFPHTEESKIVASSVRSTVSMFSGQFRDEHSGPWISHFWKRGLEIEPCSLKRND
jgi:hypothetical protein